MKHAETLLGERAEEWRRMPRCSDEERALAERFYLEQVLPLLELDFVQREHVHLPHPYLGAIVAVGRDPTPALLALATMSPERVHLIYASDAEPAVEQLIARVQPAPTPYDRSRVDEQPILQAYAAARDVHRDWGAPESVAVCLTGGPEALSAGLAMAAHMIGADLFAVEAEEYWPAVGCPRPGSQYLRLLPQPYAAFGDLAQAEAQRAYARGDYNLARELYAQLADKPDGREYRPYRDLAAAYEAWDRFDAYPAGRLLSEVAQALENEPWHPLAPHLPHLRQQADTLTRLAPLMAPDDWASIEALLHQADLVTWLAFSLWHAAERRLRAGRFDLAVLLQYRLLELLVQQRLAARGVDMAAPDYARLDGPDLPAALAERQVRLLERPPSEALPERSSLSNGLLLLHIVGDLLVEDIDWALVRRCLPVRNRSMLAHSFQAPQRIDALAFERLNGPALARFCRIVGTDGGAMEEASRFLHEA